MASGAVLVMLLWAICFPLITVGLEASPPMTLAALRAALSGMVLLVVARLTRRPFVAGKGTWKGIAFVGLTGTAIGFTGMFYGGGSVSPGLATVVANTQPLIAAGLASRFLGERLRVTQRWGLVTGFTGILLIGGPAMSVEPGQRLGMIYIVLGAVGVAVSNVGLKRLTGRIDVVWAMGWQLAIGSLPLAAVAVTLEDPLSVDWTLGFALSLTGLSLVGTAVAFVLWFGLLGHAPLSELNVFTFLTPVFGLLLGALFFGEHLHGMAAAGVVLSLAGICFVSWVPKRVLTKGSVTPSP